MTRMTSTILVTGARGFIGKNLVVALKRGSDVEVLEHDLENPEGDLERMAGEADFVFHLAGVNRPKDPEELRQGNTELTRRLCELLKKAGRKATLVLASTIQAAMDNPYGRSKKAAEDVALAYQRECGATVYAFRLPNVFGKWCLPNYNSAVATFCHNLARGLPIQVNDPDRDMALVYVDDVVRAFTEVLNGVKIPAEGDFSLVQPVFYISLSDLAGRLMSFAESRTSLIVPNMDDPLTRRLYATYISYLPEDAFGYSLVRREDQRGALAEVVKSSHFGQLFFSTTKPGITRGNHYHDSKVEKFIVVSGEAAIRLEHILTGGLIDMAVSGHEMKVVDIPPGYTHHIENVGEGDLVVLFWANELFDQSATDTYFQEVRRG